jgi:plasmid replication initiation protein
MNNITITKSNTLIESSYKLSLIEQRLVLACIGQVDSRKEVPKEVTLTATAYADMFDINHKDAYKELQGAVSKLWERTIILKDDNEEEWFRWIQKRVKYHKGEGRVKLLFSDDVIPYLGQLKEQFTSYKLHHVSGLKSTHSIRLYELLMQFKNTGKRIVSIDEFRVFFGLRDKYTSKDKYPLFKDLNKSVITPAIKELNKKTDLVVSLEKKKTGRTVTSLIFSFTHKKKAGDSHQQTSLNLPQKSPERKKKNRQRIAEIINDIKS